MGLQAFAAQSLRQNFHSFDNSEALEKFALLDHLRHAGVGTRRLRDCTKVHVGCQISVTGMGKHMTFFVPSHGLYREAITSPVPVVDDNGTSPVTSDVVAQSLPQARVLAERPRKTRLPNDLRNRQCSRAQWRRWQGECP